MTELNWMQEYAATETVELRETGVLGRREMLVRLVAICGSVGAATALAPVTRSTTTPAARTTKR